MMIQAVQRQFQAVSDAQFVVNLPQVILHNLLGGAHAQRDFFILHALRDAGNNQRLFGRELYLGSRSRRTRTLIAVCLHDPMDALAVEPRLAGDHLPQAFHQQLGFDFTGHDAVRAAAE